MTSESVFWGAVFVVALWLGLAVFRTSLGRNDRKPWTIGWLATLAAWLIVSIPAMALIAVGMFVRLPTIAVLAAAGSLWWLGFKFGERLPIIGRWVGALDERQAERAERGVI